MNYAPTATPVISPASPVAMVPNPATDFIYIKGMANGTLRIYNSIGQLVRQEFNTSGCSIADQPSGLYVVQLSDTQGHIIKTEKIIKK